MTRGGGCLTYSTEVRSALYAALVWTFLIHIDTIVVRAGSYSRACLTRAGSNDLLLLYGMHQSVEVRCIAVKGELPLIHIYSQNVRQVQHACIPTREPSVAHT